MKSIQNGQMSPEKVRKMFSEWRSQLDKLEELFWEVAVMQNARWDFPEGNYSVLATWLLYDPMAHMLFPVAEKKSWAELGSRLSEYVGWTVDWYSLRRNYTRKSLKNIKK